VKQFRLIVRLFQ